MPTTNWPGFASELQRARKRDGGLSDEIADQIVCGVHGRIRAAIRLFEKKRCSRIVRHACGAPFKDLRDLPGTIANVTLTSNTVRIDESTTHQILKSIGSDGDIFVFDNSDSRVQNLREGQIFLLDNVAVRKVLAVAKKDNLIIVGTDYASLTDFIQQGQLKWTAPIKFGSLFSAKESSAPVPPAPIMWFIPNGTVYAAGTELSYSGKVDNWDTSMSVTPSSNRLDVAFKVPKSYQGMSVMTSAKGFLKDFLSSADIQVDQGDLSNFAYNATNLNGEVK